MKLKWKPLALCRNSGRRRNSRSPTHPPGDYYLASIKNKKLKQHTYTSPKPKLFNSKWANGLNRWQSYNGNTNDQQIPKNHSASLGTCKLEQCWDSVSHSSARTSLRKQQQTLVWTRGRATVQEHKLYCHYVSQLGGSLEAGEQNASVFTDSRGPKSAHHSDPCTAAFAAALFTTATVRSQPKFPLADGRTKETQCAYIRKPVYSYDNQKRQKKEKTELEAAE